jgi:hypothetical protein
MTSVAVFVGVAAGFILAQKTIDGLHALSNRTRRSATTRRTTRQKKKGSLLEELFGL